MKKLLIYLFALTLLLPNFIFAEEENSDANADNKVEQVLEVDPNLVRDKGILVPTDKGIQQANQVELNKINELSKLPLESLTKSYLLGDYKSGKILEGYNIDEVRAMASTSKLVSIFVVFDKIKDGTIKLEDEVTIDHEVASLTGSSYKLKEGDKTTVRNLIEAAMVVSGNDAITALAKHVAGTTDNFVKMMNDKCADLGLKNAHMVNPTGLTNYEIEDYNKMTTREMFVLASELLKFYPEILEYTKIEKIEDPARNYIDYNTNPILGIVPEIDGLKTGYTNASGRCVIATGEKKAVDEKTKDMRLIGITMGSRGNFERFVASKRLMQDGFENYSYRAIGNTNEPLRTIEIKNSQDDEIPIYQKELGYALLENDEKLKEIVEIDENLVAPIEAGTSIGKISYYKNDNLIYSSDIIVKDKVFEKGIINKFKRVFEEIFINIEKAA
ncbi:D-alanyl-D-alanine carboxypeptidase [Peptoniphilus sp. MSJ-1]|uniref:D-alanyl-D-alanine carboxypeptidase n=1 Tax=Peptoniphilus ovalis TaxID=2841503 RepID=A0ABS6FEU5_9FIRM|nr:D-alanyl-D-alanine carboxypeptidase family protein [Peptoniphilus ovalis]MBU5668494.1 D-alanyl-D-alanine carboxypeptidase [Peptoniphilus ovalis]